MLVRFNLQRYKRNKKKEILSIIGGQGYRKACYILILVAFRIDRLRSPTTLAFSHAISQIYRFANTLIRPLVYSKLNAFRIMFHITPHLYIHLCTKSFKFCASN